MHLELLSDDEQCISICKDYWRQNEEGKFALKVQEISASHGMKPHIVSKYVEQHAYVWSEVVRCVRCQKPYRFGTRGQYQERNLYKGTVCKSCIKDEINAITEHKKQILLKTRQSAENKEIDLEKLDLKSIIYLLATIQALGDEYLSTIEPLCDYPACTLSPDVVYDQKILKHLSNKGLLIISLNTRPEALVLQENNEFHISLDTSTFDIFLEQRQIIELTSYFFDTLNMQKIEENPEFIELCKELQLSECLSFLKVMLGEHRLLLSPGEKTRQVLSKCLERFSVAQVYNFIWRAARDAAAYYMRSSISKRQAANSVVGLISRNMERSLANNWAVNSFHRNYKLPQSSLSRIVFNAILSTDDAGFKVPLHELISFEDS